MVPTKDKPSRAGLSKERGGDMPIKYPLSTREKGQGQTGLSPRIVEWHPSHGGWGLSVPRNNQAHVHKHSPDPHWTPNRPIINGMLVWKSFISSINQTYGPIKIQESTMELILRGSSQPMCLLGVLGAQETCLLRPWWQSKGTLGRY